MLPTLPRQLSRRCGRDDTIQRSDRAKLQRVKPTLRQTDHFCLALIGILTRLTRQKRKAEVGLFPTSARIFRFSKSRLALLFCARTNLAAGAPRKDSQVYGAPAEPAGVSRAPGADSQNSGPLSPHPGDHQPH